MLIQFEINGKSIQFGQSVEPPISVIQIRVSGFPIDIPIEQVPLVKNYLKGLVNNMLEDGYVIYNGILTYKQDINTNI